MSLPAIIMNSGAARSQMTPGHCTHFFFFVSKGGGLTNAVGLESGVVLTHDFSIRAHSTALHQY